MVAVLVRLRFRVLATALARNTFQLVAVIMGGLQGVFLLLLALVGLAVASTAPPAATQAVVVVGGAALLLGWIVVPLLFGGVEQTLDPVKLARFPVSTRQLMGAMFLVGVTWIPGIVTILISLGAAIAWWMHPVSAVVAIVAGLVGAATCIAGSRLTTSVVGAVLRGRGARRIGIAALVVLALISPLAIAAIVGASTGGGDLLAAFTGAVGVLGWTPLGAVWSVPGRIAMGDLAGAAVASAIAIATLLGVILLWRWALQASLRSRGGGPSRTVRGGRLGPLGWLPASPTGAVAARSLIYWFRDARLARQLVIIPVLPALMLLWWWLIGIDWIALAIGPVVASLLPLSVFAGLSFDGTAFAAELAAGVRGVFDRLGRAIALLIIATPAVLIVQVVVALVIRRADDLPALVGLSLGILLVAVGVVSVSSARIVVPVPRSGRNPFSAPAGAATTSIVASYAVMGATIVLALPAIGVAIAAMVTRDPLLEWIALVLGVALGVAIAWIGIRVGGRVLDASGPAVLARLRLIRA